MIHTIYAHINKINNKVYIGQTIQEPEKRWKKGKAYKPCTLFYAAIQKYGWDNFDHVILEQNEMSQQEADEKEQYYINQYDSLNPKKGYNINQGGYKTISPKAEEAAIAWMKEHPEFCMARVQEMLKWQKENPEQALKIRKENQKKAAESRRRPVICIETGVVYESASEAARQVPNTNQGKICMVCRGRRNTNGGFHWAYADINNEENNKDE